MTRMLAIVRNSADAAMAVAGGVDGIVVSPRAREVAGIIAAAAQAGCPVSLWRDSDISTEPADSVATAGDKGADEIWTGSENPAPAGRHWIVASPSELSGAPSAASEHRDGIVIASRHEEQRLLAELSIAALERLRRDVEAHGLKFGIAGAMEPPDVPRLLALRPDFLAMDDLLRDETSAISAGKLRLVRELMAEWHASDPTALPAPQAGTLDRIFVRDWTVSLALGAYDHERAPQRVRFNIEAEVVRSVQRASDMRHVVTYDLITDAIARATITHVALVETIAEDVAAMILAHPRVSGVDVSVEKLDLGPGALGCRILRHRAS